MFDFDKWEEIFGSIRRHKLRTFLTAFSVWWGIFMLVILLGAGNGMQNSVEEDFKEDSMNTLWVWRGNTSEPYNGLPAGRRINFDNKDYEMASEMEEVQFSSGRYFLWGEFFITYKDKSLSFDVRCVHPGYQLLENQSMESGRYINDTDIDEKRKVCAIGTEVKKDFFGDEEAIGEYLNIKGIKYKVVGVYLDAGGDREQRRIFIPVSTAQQIEGTDRLHNITVDIGEVTPEESVVVENKIRRQMAAKHNFSPNDKNAIHIYNAIEQAQEFRMLFSFIKIFIWFVGIGSIIAGVIGVSNIMLIIVKDRTKEIGIRKALGATPISIISMIVQEAVFLTSVAGYVGLASGLGVIYGLQQVMEKNNIEAEYFRNPEVDMTTMIVALLILIVSGAVSGLIPAIQAVKINPVVAMKS